MDPADERAHIPGAASWWETWHLDAATAGGVGVSVRLACAPALGIAWWWTHLLLPDVAGPVVVRDHEVGLPRQGLEIRADGLWGELTCESPFEHWTYGLEAFGVRLDDPADSLRGEIGERMAVGLDIEWEVDPDADPPYEYRGDPELAGYEQLGRVRGEILLERSRWEIDAVGLRSHTWGTPGFDRPADALWARGTDLDVSFTASGGHVDGHFALDERSESISTVRTETRRRADGLPVAARHVVNDRLEIDAEVLGLVTIPVGGASGNRSTLARGLCRYEVFETGAKGIGWSSWLDPE